MRKKGRKSPEWVHYVKWCIALVLGYMLGEWFGFGAVLLGFLMWG